MTKKATVIRSNRKLYKDQGHTVGGYRAVSIDRNEIRLQGRRGFIVQHSSDRLSATVAVRAGMEKKYFFDIKDLKKAFLRIGHFTRVADQIRYANNVNLIHD